MADSGGNRLKNLESRMDECERRILVLEKFREKDKNESVDTKSNVKNVISKIEDLVKAVDILPENLEKLMEKNFIIQQKEHDKIYTELEEIKNDSMENKQKIKELEQKINDQTTGKNSKKWEDFKWLFVAGGVGLIFLVLQSLIKVVIK